MRRASAVPAGQTEPLPPGRYSVTAVERYLQGPFQYFSASVLPMQIFLWSDEIDRAFVQNTSAAIIVLLIFLLGVLLTGMGQDGARGLKALRERGYLTIAQDQASSAVYGMPKAAAAMQAAVEISPLDQIAPRVIQALA